MASTTTTKPKKYICTHDGCGKGFTRSDHLQRHVLNHGLGESTCPRCSLHFKRPDLLDRHMARHRQKDEEAGGEGLGVIESRKKLWRDPDGNIVNKRPAQSECSDSPTKKQATESVASSTSSQPMLVEAFNGQAPLHAEPLSPPRSMLSSESFEHFSHQLPELPDDHDFISSATGHDNTMFDFLANSSWGSNSTTALNVSGEMPIDDMFAADTASSFNMPFTTMNNYNWLFDVGGQQNLSMVPDAQNAIPDSQMQFQSTTQNTSEVFKLNDGVSGNTTTSTNSLFKQPALPRPPAMEAFQMSEIFQFSGMTPHNAGMANTLSTSPMGSDSTANPANEVDFSPPTTTSPDSMHTQAANQPNRMMNNGYNLQTLPPSQPRRIMPTMDDVSRNQILDLLVAARPKTPEGSEISRDHPLLTLSSMQNYLDLFFSRFNVAYPLLHQPTFDPSQTEPLLLLAVLLLGATYSEKAIHRLAVCIHDVLRAQIFQHSAFSAMPELWMLQTILLVECFGKSRAGQKQHDMAHLFHGLLINLIRRSDCQTVRQPNFGEGSGDLESDWRKAIDVELRKRLAFLCFLWDTQHAVLFSQSLCMSSFELRTTLPCNQTTWEASSAEEWWKYARKEPQISYLSVLKAYMNPDSGAQIPQLNALSRLLVLHGLMSVQWDMKRRDQTSLGVGNPSGPNAPEQPKWQERLAQSYDAWKADFETYCMNMTLSLNDNPTRKAEFTRFSTATIAIYHAAHITLNVEILDLQIYAGARHIIGRPVTRADYDRSRRIVKDWAKPTPGGSTPAAKAAWHAAHMLRDGIMNLDNWDVNNAFHYPWCLYLSTLTCWAFHFANVVDKSLSSAPAIGGDRNMGHAKGQESPLDQNNSVDDGIVWHAKAEMNALVSSMTSVIPENLWRGLGKYSTSGLTTVMAKHLSNIRWAVVHEGMKVLRGLVPERCINEYETFLK
ncbi:fungal-specific transcription factor domain-containing protein [Exophiala viscosa]|uniref:fungal-specific transcription factor domain-containing protein n=1 Tax=Exophiala viscosa TaxID=2486360 RepID=UPI0021934DBD|nr:fungal-specific transcription factor domain-containing protein [Exophiala viscosa]